MKIETMFMMFVMLVFFWGGFIFTLILASKKEANKKSSEGKGRK